MAAVDYFLKLDGIDGESQDAKHKGELDVESFSLGLSNSGSASQPGGAGTGKVAFQDFHFVTRTSKASPKLFLACASGEHIKQAIVTARKAGGDQIEFLKITMSDLLVSSFQGAGAQGPEGSEVPTEQVSLNFSKIEVWYQTQSDTGAPGEVIVGGWDLKSNKKV